MLHDAKIVSVDTDPAIYHTQEAVRGSKEFVMSRSELIEFHHCPRRWLHGVEQKESDALAFGALMDVAILQPDRFDSTYEVLPQFYPAGKQNAQVKSGEVAEGDPVPWSKAATFCKDHAARIEASGKMPVDVDDYEAVKGAAARLFADSYIGELLSCSQRQVMVTAFWNDVPLKVLLDLKPDIGNRNFGSFIYDFKCLRSAHPLDFPRAMFDYGWDWQAAFYSDLFNCATGENRSFHFLLVENTKPYEPGLMRVSEDWIENARWLYEKTLTLYEQCLTTGKFPGYNENDKNALCRHSTAEPQTWMVTRMAGV